jgi:hypothetical protein
MLYSKDNQYPQPIPFRIVLSDGRTRTDPSSFTEEEIADAGYVAVEDKPIAEENQLVNWIDGSWVIYTKTQEELDTEIANKLASQWSEIRNQRDMIMANFDWRYTRYEREIRLSLTPKDNLVALDVYMQALADVTNQEDPYNINWPVYSLEEDPEQDI